MSYVIDVFSLDADETVFSINDNSWPTHINTNNTVSAPFHESSTSTNNELTENNNYMKITNRSVVLMSYLLAIYFNCLPFMDLPFLMHQYGSYSTRFFYGNPNVNLRITNFYTYWKKSVLGEYRMLHGKCLKQNTPNIQI